MIVKDKSGCYFNDEKITEEKYNEILNLIRNRPTTVVTAANFLRNSLKGLKELS